MKELKIWTESLQKTPELYNLYGTTECSCWASFKKVDVSNLDDNENSRIDIGKPIYDTEIMVVPFDDENQNEISNILNAIKGEIWIGSETRICYVGNEDQPRRFYFVFFSFLFFFLIIYFI